MRLSDRLPRSAVARIGLLALTCVLLGGCATIKTVLAHPQQDRLERLLAGLQPHTQHPEAKTWVRVLQPTKPQVDLWVLRQRHIYLSEVLVTHVDDAALTALLAHGIAHHDLAHHGKRGIMRGVQYLGFLVGGLFVPGLGLGWPVADQVMEGAMSAGQELTADARTVAYLARMGSSAEEYVRALEFLATRHFVERTGGIWTTQEGFSRRIAALKRRHTAQPQGEAPTDTQHSNAAE